jgi:hypothetical protein
MGSTQFKFARSYVWDTKTTYTGVFLKYPESKKLHTIKSGNLWGLRTLSPLKQTLYVIRSPYLTF